jgi:hypothetical protein
MDEIVSVDDDQFGLAGPIVGESDDLVADRDVLDRAADFLDETGQVGALSRGKRRGPPIGKGTLSDRGLAWIDTCSLDPDEDLARSWDGSVDLHDAENVNSAVLVEPHCTRHGSSP